MMTWESRYRAGTSLSIVESGVVSACKVGGDGDCGAIRTVGEISLEGGGRNEDGL
jgi:hypothetical protein